MYTSTGTVCPLSMTGEQPKMCNPNCRLYSEGKCLLAEYLKKKLNQTG